MLALAVLGLAGCAIALMALAFDWRETEDYRDLHWYERADDPTTSSGKVGWRVGETVTVQADFGTQWAAKDEPSPADLEKRLQ